MITGSLSSELLSLSKLEQLDLNGNRMTGSINGIGVMPHLEFLQLHDNAFTGQVPESLGLSSNLGTFKANRCTNLALFGQTARASSSINHFAALPCTLDSLRNASGSVTWSRTAKICDERFCGDMPHPTKVGALLGCREATTVGKLVGGWEFDG
jgi:hypothetical protein